MAGEQSQTPSGSPACGASRGTRQRRITRACDYCHQRSIRCRPSPEDSATCQNCKEFVQSCTYQRKVRRRGVRPRNASRVAHDGEPSGASRSASSLASRTLATATTIVAPADAAVRAQVEAPLSSSALPENAHDLTLSWQAPQVARQATIMDLVELYFEIVYPIFPLFHQPTFMRKISRAEYTSDKSLFANTMAVCALVGGRVRDGSVTNPRWDLRAIQEVSPDTFYSEAERHLVHGYNEECDTSLNTIRAHAILAIASIQNGKIRDMQRHLGTYHTLVAMEGLHDEANWPRDIGNIEREERRRLFWSIYTLDVFTSVVWGGVVRSREKQSNVDYPIEMDDELIDDKGLIDTSLSSAGLGTSLNHVPGAPTECWLSGWNFITDLYRVLEHALARFRSHRNRRRRNSFLREIFDDQPMATEESVRDSVLKMYISLPSCFKETPEMTFNVRKDRFGFQAANITASLQLVRMVLFAADGASIAERCQIASDVVKAFASIPVSYLLAICMPLLHHLGGIGVILGSVLGEPLNQTDYNHVRSIMLSMAQLLEDLEAIHQSSSASEKLRSQVARIDEYMQSERLEIPARHPGPTDESSIVQPWMADHNDSINAAENHDQDEARAWSFQIPPDLLDELNWSFDFNQSVDLLER